MTSNAIWLDGWEAQDIKEEPGETVVFASYLPQPTHCPKCGVVDRLYRHGSKTIDYRDAPAFGNQTTIRAEVARTVGLDEKTVRNVCEGYLERELARRVVDVPAILGIDELTLAGRKRTIFVDVGNRAILDIIDAMHRSRFRTGGQMPHGVMPAGWSPY